MELMAHGRIAFYERSKDGINWKVESGEAYLPGVSVHEDGTVEGWWKYERLKVFQDKYGRAIQGNFAVIDVENNLDRGSDIHSSKNISIPLIVGRLLTILDKKPITAGNVFPNDEFTAKMSGKTSTGKLLFGYARLPGVNFIEPILSPLLPVITAKDNGFSLKVEVQNFGQVASKKAKLKVGFIKDDKEVDVAAGTIPALNPYEKTSVELTCGNLFDKGVEYIFKVTVNPDDKQPAILHGKTAPVK